MKLTKQYNTSSMLQEGMIFILLMLTAVLYCIYPTLPYFLDSVATQILPHHAQIPLRASTAIPTSCELIIKSDTPSLQ